MPQYQYAVGKGDRFALEALKMTGSPLGSLTWYSEPSFEPFYSKHGFIFPLTQDTRSIDQYFDEGFPRLDLTYIEDIGLNRFLMIDHEGRLWRLLVYMKKDSSLTHLKYGSIYPNCGWWLIDGTSSPENSTAEKKKLMGFLTTNPSEEEISDYWTRNFLGESLEWFSISDIVTKLNEDYPAERKPEFTESELRARNSLQNIIDSLNFSEDSEDD